VSCRGTSVYATSNSTLVTHTPSAELSTQSESKLTGSGLPVTSWTLSRIHYTHWFVIPLVIGWIASGGYSWGYRRRLFTLRKIYTWK